jgi:hypothetical protein
MGGAAGSGAGAYVTGPVYACKATTPVCPDGSRTANSVPVPDIRSWVTGLANVSGTTGPAGSGAGEVNAPVHGTPAAYLKWCPGATSSTADVAGRGNSTSALHGPSDGISQEES